MTRDTLADTLRHRAKVHGLETWQIGERCGLSERQVRRILSGETAKLEVVETVGGVLGLRLEWVPR